RVSHHVQRRAAPALARRARRDATHRRSAPQHAYDARRLARPRDRGSAPRQLSPRASPAAHRAVASPAATASRDRRATADHFAREWLHRRLSPRDALSWAGMKIAIIGAGAAGISMGIALRRAGHDFTILERSPGVGGTWHDNVYPGAGCDVPSHLYCFSYA